MPAFFSVVLFVWLLLGSGMRSWADTLTFEADPYMPYTGDSDKGETGFMIDIVKAVFEAKGYTVSYQSTSWSGALHDIKEGRATALVGLSKLDAPSLVFPKTEQGRAQGAFYVPFDSGWKYAGAASLEGVLLGIVDDYKYNPEVGDYIAKNRGNSKKIRAFVGGTSNLADLVSAVADKKIGAFVEDRNVVGYFLKSSDKADKVIEAGKLTSTTDLYVAFSPSLLNAQELAAQLSEELAAMRADGRLKTILDKYGLTDWATGAR